MQGSCVPANGKKIHPRMRGEEYAVYIRPRPIWESPPRARGRVSMVMTTNPMTRRNHPRVRGEEYKPNTRETIRRESPPRARGRAPCPTMTRSSFRESPPRARGRASAPYRCRPLTMESPPRARGRVHRKWLISNVLGITPACAGKSFRRAARLLPVGNHPRVRGEESIK